MGRRESAESINRPEMVLGVRSGPDPRGIAFALVCSTLTFLFVVPAAVAGPADLLLVASPPPAAVKLLAEPPTEPPILPIVHVAPIVESFEPESEPEPELETLLLLRGAGEGSWKPLTTDESLAAAVASGTNPDLEPRNPFRKRSRDLFRAERPVSIGNRELLMRLRLRAKAKRAVSVEFRF